MNRCVFGIGLFWGAMITTGTRSESLPRPVFTGDGKFDVRPAEEVTLVQTPLPFPVYFFSYALGECGHNVKAVSKVFHDFANSKKINWIGVMAKLFPDFESRLSQLKLVVLLDTYGAERRYSSFFMPDFDSQGTAAISMDCSRAQSWGPKLQHELVHALLVNAGLDHWVEETLAQAIETEEGGGAPARAGKEIVGPHLPSLTGATPSFGESKTYGMTYWFGRFLLARGGWRELQDLITLDKGDLEEYVKDFATALFTGKIGRPNPRVPGWITPASLDPKQLPKKLGGGELISVRRPPGEDLVFNKDLTVVSIGAPKKPDHEVILNFGPDARMIFDTHVPATFLTPQAEDGRKPSQQ